MSGTRCRFCGGAAAGRFRWRRVGRASSTETALCALCAFAMANLGSTARFTLTDGTDAGSPPA